MLILASQRALTQTLLKLSSSFQTHPIMQFHFHASHHFARMGEHVENESFLPKLYHFREFSRLCHWNVAQLNIAQQIIPMCVCVCRRAHTRAYKERRAQYKQPIANPQPAHCQARSFMVESEVLSTNRSSWKRAAVWVSDDSFKMFYFFI